MSHKSEHKVFLFYVGFLLSVLVLLIGFHRRKDVFVYDDKKAAPVALKTDEEEKVILRKNAVVVARRKDGGKVEATRQYVPPEGSVSVVRPVAGGDVKVRVKDIGLTFSPGAGVGLVGTRPGAFVFARFAYWRRLGLTAGVGVSTDAEFVPHVGLTWHVLSNTSAYVGVGSEAAIVLGVAVKF